MQLILIDIIEIGIVREDFITRLLKNCKQVYRKLKRGQELIIVKNYDFSMVFSYLIIHLLETQIN